MNKYLGCLALLLTFSPCFSQYTVTKVSGTVKNKVSGEMLKTGSVFKDANTLVFASPNAAVRAIVTGKGVIVLSADMPKEAKSTVATDIFKYTFNLKSKQGFLSGRGVNVEMIPDALLTDTTFNEKALFEKENRYSFDNTVYQVANGDKFFLQIDYPGKEPVIHPLISKADTLLIAASDFQSSGMPQTTGAKYTLGFFSKEKNSGEALAEIKPYLDFSGEMNAIVNAMVRESKESDSVQLRQLCYREVYEALGKPAEQGFQHAFDKAFSMYQNKVSRKDR